ncbi:hypothetical protein WMY93_019039 [Mugilogobius chulae]|uniref:Uncharacterized protein n=1 Tax=Mugilogobius chulae TaxID=88201 RepID=A0AAW0ND62_9GOBI
MFPQFKKIWTYFHDSLLPTYSSLYGGLNVVAGPVFDYNFDGRFDSSEQILQFVPGSKIPVPTHFFIVLTSCRDSTSSVLNCEGPLQTVSFVLPHRDTNTESCQVKQLSHQDTNAESCQVLKLSHRDTNAESCQVKQLPHRDTNTESCQVKLLSHRDTNTESCQVKRLSHRDTNTESCQVKLLSHRDTNTESCQVKLLSHRDTNTESCQTDAARGVWTVLNTPDAVALWLQSSGAESEWVEDLMWFHQSRVRDVELLTGLDFYQGSSRPITELLQLKTRPTADIHRKQ